MALFAVDDSEVIIAGSRHTLLSAVTFSEPAKIVDRLAALRRELSLPATFEFKWNSRGLAPSVRDAIGQAFRELAFEALTFLTIVEGTDRQHAASYLVQQIADVIEGTVVPVVIFDESILREESVFRRALVENERLELTRMQVSSARSFANDLVQCADVFAGFYNLKIRLALGEAKDRIMRFEPDGFEWTLSDLLEASLSSSLWGQDVLRVEAGWDDALGPPPGRYREAEGLGLRIHSSVEGAIRARLFDTVGRPYTGCWA